MKNLTLIIPAKNEYESLPTVLEELSEFKYNINIVLHSSDKKTITQSQIQMLKFFIKKTLDMVML